jgi:hypothetical protein
MGIPHDTMFAMRLGAKTQRNSLKKRLEGDLANLFKIPPTVLSEFEMFGIRSAR